MVLSRYEVIFINGASLMRRINTGSIQARPRRDLVSHNALIE